LIRKRTEANRNAEKRYDEKRAGQRTRNWAVIFYPEDLPEDWTSLIDAHHVKWVEGPIHDKDVNADGTPKKTHCHSLFIFENVKTLEQIEELLKGIFGESGTGAIIGVAKPQQATDRSAIVRYMAHMDNPEKAQYDVSKIIGHNGADVAEILKYSATETRLMLIAMEEFIEENGILEVADFSKAIRYDNPEWYTILTTKMTMYFTVFIRSCRHKAAKPPEIVKIDSETGEVL
jgi:hypothetical protein